MNRKAILIFFAGLLTACLMMVGIGSVWVYSMSNWERAERDRAEARFKEQEIRHRQMIEEEKASRSKEQDSMKN